MLRRRQHSCPIAKPFLHHHRLRNVLSDEDLLSLYLTGEAFRHVRSGCSLLLDHDHAPGDILRLFGTQFHGSQPDLQLSMPGIAKATNQNILEPIKGPLIVLLVRT